MMVSDGVLSLIEVVALALPAYTLVIKAMADQSVRYPPEVVYGLAAALGLVLVAGVLLVGWVIYTGMPFVPALGALFVIASFVAMAYGLYHFADRQAELEKDDEEAEKQEQ